MMSTDIVNEIAHLMAQRDLTLKGSKEARPLKAQKGLSVPEDSVSFTMAAKTPAGDGTPESEMAKEQALKVERLKALVGGGNYKLDHKMVESIAENIANMLV